MSFHAHSSHSHPKIEQSKHRWPVLRLFLRSPRTSTRRYMRRFASRLTPVGMLLLTILLSLCGLTGAAQPAQASVLSPLTDAATSGNPQLLPGETLFPSGFSSYLFGANDASWQWSAQN